MKIVFVKMTDYGVTVCGNCGAELVCDDCGDMPDKCPDCGCDLDYSKIDE